MNHRLWCFVDGVENAFQVVSTPEDEHIDDLKNKIYEKINSSPFINFPAYWLNLWKLTDIIPIEPSDTLAERIRNLGPDFSQFAERLWPTQTVAEVFHNHQTPTSQLSIIVELPVSTTFPKQECEESSGSTRSSTSEGPKEQDIFSDESVQKELTSAGYELTFSLKPTVYQGISQSGAVVALKTIVEPNEHQLLRYLTGIKAAPSNHAIPLLDTIDLSIGKTIIVLPWKSPLDRVLRGHPDNVVSLCLQFVEGVAFLHRHNIAHCDLKPGNIVVGTTPGSEASPQLFIIDFDFALSVESKETKMKGWCGTPPWIAPELGTRKGPIQQYSPILADRWACGRMIKYFMRYIPEWHYTRQKRILSTFARRLLNINPNARPDLNQLQITDRPMEAQVE